MHLINCQPWPRPDGHSGSIKCVSVGSSLCYLMNVLSRVNLGCEIYTSFASTTQEVQSTRRGVAELTPGASTPVKLRAHRTHCDVAKMLQWRMCVNEHVVWAAEREGALFCAKG